MTHSVSVTKQFGRGPATLEKDFDNLNDAKTYIAEKLGADIDMKIDTTYQINDVGEVIDEYNAKNYEKIANLIAPAQDESSSSGKGSGANFRPTPFSTTAKPKGAQQNWMKDDEEEKNKE